MSDVSKVDKKHKLIISPSAKSEFDMEFTISLVKQLVMFCFWARQLPADKFASRKQQDWQGGSPPAGLQADVASIRRCVTWANLIDGWWS